MGVEWVDRNGDTVDMTGGELVGRKAESEHPDAHLFEDIFPATMPPLTDMFVDTLKKWDNNVSLPIPIYTFKDRLYATGRNTTIEPGAFHQAVDLGATASEIVETATAHHQKLRDLGMTIVGHQFEIIDPNDNRFETYQKYPTILAGAKLPQIPPREDRNAKPTFTTFGGDIKQTLDTLEVEASEFVTAVVDPIESYLEWCGSSNQEYVLSWLTETSGYFHHALTGRIALQRVTTALGSIELGNLESRKIGFEYLKEGLQKQGIIS